MFLEAPSYFSTKEKPVQDYEFPSYIQLWASLVAQMVKNLPAVQEIWVRSLDLEDPLEKRKYFCLENPMEPGRLPSMGSQLDTTKQLTLALTSIYS